MYILYPLKGLRITANATAPTQGCVLQNGSKKVPQKKWRQKT